MVIVSVAIVVVLAVVFTVRAVREDAALEPWVLEDLRGGEAFRRFPAQHAADQALGPRGDGVRDGVLTPADLTEQRARLHVVERVAADQHGVEDYPEGPDVCSLAAVRLVHLQDLRRHVRWTTVLVGHRVVIVIVKNICVL